MPQQMNRFHSFHCEAELVNLLIEIKASKLLQISIFVKTGSFSHVPISGGIFIDLSIQKIFSKYFHEKRNWGEKQVKNEA